MLNRLLYPGLACIISFVALTNGGCGTNLVAAPESLAYGPVFVGDQVTRSVVWTHEGGGEVVLDGVRLSDRSGTFEPKPSNAWDEPIRLKEGESSPQLQITFAPDAYRGYEARLTPRSGGSSESQVVTLTGQGVYLMERGEALELEAAGLSRSQPLDVGQTPVGETNTHELTLVNQGSSELRLQVDWQNAGRAFSIANASESIRIPYGESRTLTLRFQPDDSGIATDTLKLNSAENQTLAGVVITGVGKQ